MGEAARAAEDTDRAAGDADCAALRAAMADVTPLPPGNRVELRKPKPARSLPDAPPSRHEPRKVRAEPDLPARWQQRAAPPRFSDDPEQAALQRAMQGVAPLPERNLAHLDKPRPAPQARQRAAERQAVLADSLGAPIALQDRLEGGDEAAYLRHGLAQTVLRDLCRGRWVIQGEIDLHGLNREQARHQVAAFLQTALHQGKRCLRIVHGKGLGSPQKLSVLRQLLRGWLAQRQEVLAYCQARPQDGGEGALLVLLRAAR